MHQIVTGRHQVMTAGDEGIIMMCCQEVVRSWSGGVHKGAYM